MKNIFLLLILLSFLTGCNDQKLTPQESVTTYYNARDAGSFETLKTVINDSITIISGDYVMPYNHDSFYEEFKWDSIFKSSYKIITLSDQQNKIIATISQHNQRNAFLKNNPLVFNVDITFTDGKISNIKELDYLDVNWKSWEQEKDSLVQWIATNHPELDGFVYDMTMKGAMNYLKAIALYEGNEKR